MPATTTWLTPKFISHLEALKLSTRWVRAGTRLGGRFAVNRRGSSIEFADYLPYTAGDDIRSIDWNLYARLDRLFVKTYKEEIELAVEIIVDATASMGLPSLAKFERAKQVALSLGYIALGSHHYVRLSWVRPVPIAASPWFHERRDLWPMVAHAEHMQVAGQATLSHWVARAAASLSMRGGQAILVTDGMHRVADFFHAMHLLMVRNIELKVIQILTPQELHPAKLLRGGILIDAETGASHQLAYPPAELERAVAAHNEQLVRFCKRHGIPFAQHQIDEPLESFFIQTLPGRGLLE